MTDGGFTIRHYGGVIRQFREKDRRARRIIMSMTVSIFQRGPWPEWWFWGAYTLLSFVAFTPPPYTFFGFLVTCFFSGGGALASYTHLGYGLLPRLEGRRGIGGYVLVLFAAVAAGCAFTLGGLYAVTFIDGIVLPPAYTGFVAYWLPRVGWSIATILSISAVVFLFAHRRRQAARERALEAAKTQAELAYLRAQLNPHFLFNALNNIYILIRQDPERARESLLGFSDLFRYQLYAGEEDCVPLVEEVAHLRRFAELSLLRMEEDFQFSLDLDGVDGGRYRVPPMLLQPLLENAFKYSPRQAGFVRATLHYVDGTFRFHVRNNIDATPPPRTQPGDGGIGLSNLRKRLVLLYPAGHELTTERRADFFEAILSFPTHG